MTSAAKFRGEQRLELQHPSSNRFIGDVQPALGEQILDIAEAQGEAKVQPHRVSNDVRRKLVASKRDRCHSPSLGADPERARVPVSIPVRVLVFRSDGRRGRPISAADWSARSTSSRRHLTLNTAQRPRTSDAERTSRPQHRTCSSGSGSGFGTAGDGEGGGAGGFGGCGGGGFGLAGDAAGTAAFLAEVRRAFTKVLRAALCLSRSEAMPSGSPVTKLTRVERSAPRLAAYCGVRT
jgi:hypothetical protein